MNTTTGSNTGEPAIRVLQVFHSLGMGGAETWLIEMLRHWSQTKEVHCDFLLTSNEAGAFDDEARSLGANLFVVPYGRRQLFEFAREFREVLRNGRYHAIHDHQDRASGWHFAMGWPLLPKVCITHVHNASNQIRDNYGVSVARRLTGLVGKQFMRRFSTHIAATSSQVIEEYGFTGYGFSHIPKAALHCAFNTNRFLGLGADARQSVCQELAILNPAKMILFAGRMDQSAELDHSLNQKNSAFAVDVAITNLRNNENTQILFAGAISDALPILQRRIAANGLQGRFHFLGVRQDIERLMLASDLLLFPSRGEGLGMVAVEAQAAGLRVLASTAVPRECVVIPELVTFVDLKQSAAAWSNMIDTILSQPRADGKAFNVQVASSAFSVPQCSDRLCALYSRGIL